MYPVLPSANTSTNTRHSHVYLEATSSSQQRDIGKRNSSMIFRIEHLLPTTESSSADISQAVDAATSTTANRDICSNQVSTTTKRLKMLPPAKIRSGVYMAQFTSKDTRSETFSTLSVMSTANIKSAPEQVTSYCQLSNGMLCMSPTILRQIKLSEDIHSYNALFEIWNGNVRVRVIRDIARDEELVAWFDEETTILMSIPFLTPLNIQGNNRYTCHLCHLTFETPNPLKIHLALGCGHHSMDILWIRLHYALKATSFSQQLMPILPPPAPTPLPPTQIYRTQLSPIQQPTTSSSSTNSPANTPPPLALPSHELQRFSAFKPIATTTTGTQPITSVATPITTLPLTSTQLTTTASTSSAAAFLHLMHPSSALATSLHPPPATQQPMSLLQSNINVNQLNAAAQIEAIVSNMGTSKQGHLCIYCGKVYSRKYGLKIHIRTHTGFKPLKCKYCLRPFGDPSNLNKHVRLHQQACAPSGTDTIGGAQQPIEGYKCRICHKVLARRRDLQRHMETRHSQAMTAAAHGQRNNKTQRR